MNIYNNKGKTKKSFLIFKFFEFKGYKASNLSLKD